MDEPATSDVRSKAAPPESPFYGRLSIAHLLLITAGSAIAVWLQQPPGMESSVVAVTLAVTLAPVYGTAMAAIVISLSQRPARPFAAQPGHWLLLLIGNVFAGLGLAWRMAFMVRSPGAPVPKALLFMAAVAIAWPLLLTFALVFFIQAVRDVRQPAPWRLVFWLFAGTVFLPCCLPALPVAALYAVVEDLREPQHRDLWHWFGVAALFGVVMHLTLLWLALPAGLFVQ
jgi:hypothetical protein